MCDKCFPCIVGGRDCKVETKLKIFCQETSLLTIVVLDVVETWCTSLIARVCFALMPRVLQFSSIVFCVVIFNLLLTVPFNFIPSFQSAVVFYVKRTFKRCLMSKR